VNVFADHSTSFLSGAKRSATQRVECKGNGFARFVSTVNGRTGNPIRWDQGYRDTGGRPVRETGGRWYRREADGTITTGRGSYQDGQPCADCIKIKPVDPLDPPVIDEKTGELVYPVKPIDIEYPVDIVEPDDNGVMLEGAPVNQTNTCACDGLLDQMYGAGGSQADNAAFLKAWVASGLAGTPDNFNVPVLTQAEWDAIPQVLKDNGGQWTVNREWPGSVKWVARRDASMPTKETCAPDYIEPREIVYRYCVCVNDPNMTGGNVGATHAGSLVIEIRYGLFVLGAAEQPAFVSNYDQRYWYDAENDQMVPCDAWELVSDPVQPSDPVSPNIPPVLPSSPVQPSSPFTPTSPISPLSPLPPPASPQKPVLEIPSCIRPVGDKYIYCPPTSCGLGITAEIPNSPTSVVPPPQQTETASITIWNAAIGAPVQVQATRIVGSGADGWSEFGVRPMQPDGANGWRDSFTQYSPVTVQQVPTITGAAFTPRDFDMVYSNTPRLNDALGTLTPSIPGMDNVTDHAVTSASDPTNPVACYEAFVALEPFPRWYAKIGSRYVEIVDCCPETDSCCDDTMKELTSIKQTLGKIIELVSRKDAGERSPAVDLTPILSELKSIREKVDSAPVATQYDDTQLLRRIGELEQTVRSTATKPYDDSVLRQSIEDVKSLIVSRCEKCQTQKNYDTKLDEILAAILLIPRTVQTATGTIEIPNYDSQFAALSKQIADLRYATGPDYTSRFIDLQKQIADLRLTCPTTQDYSSRFASIDQMLSTIQQQTTRNYDGQLAMIVSILRELQAVRPTTYDDRFNALETLVRNVKVAEARDYNDRFTRIEQLISSLTLDCGRDYEPVLREIRDRISAIKIDGGTQLLPETSTTVSPQSPTGPTTPTEGKCATTVNCGSAANDYRLDRMLDMLIDMKSESKPESFSSRFDELMRTIESFRNEQLRSDDSKYSELQTILLNLQSQLGRVQGSTSVTIPNTPDVRIDEVLKLLAVIQNTTGAMSGEIERTKSELSLLTNNYKDVRTAFTSAISDLETTIRTQGSTASTYDQLAQMRSEYEFQRAAYEANIRAVEQRLNAVERLSRETQSSQPPITITNNVSGGSSSAFAQGGNSNAQGGNSSAQGGNSNAQGGNSINTNTNANTQSSTIDGSNSQNMNGSSPTITGSESPLAAPRTDETQGSRPQTGDWPTPRGKPKMIERHERIYYDYPPEDQEQSATQECEDEC